MRKTERIFLGIHEVYIGTGLCGVCGLREMCWGLYVRTPFLHDNAGREF